MTVSRFPLWCLTQISLRGNEYEAFATTTTPMGRLGGGGVGRAYLTLTGFVSPSPLVGIHGQLSVICVCVLVNSVNLAPVVMVPVCTRTPNTPRCIRGQSQSAGSRLRWSETIPMHKDGSLTSPRLCKCKVAATERGYRSLPHKVPWLSSRAPGVRCHSSLSRTVQVGLRARLRPSLLFPGGGLSRLFVWLTPPRVSLRQLVSGAHSSRAQATSWAIFKGVPLQEVCDAANWSSGRSLQTSTLWTWRLPHWLRRFWGLLTPPLWEFILRRGPLLNNSLPFLRPASCRGGGDLRVCPAVGFSTCCPCGGFRHRSVWAREHGLCGSLVRFGCLCSHMSALCRQRH